MRCLDWKSLIFMWWFPARCRDVIDVIPFQVPILAIFAGKSCLCSPTSHSAERMLPLAKGGWIYWHLLPLGASWCISSHAFPFEEMLLEAYTPREHLLFQSSLRMPRDVTKAEREQRVDASIKMFLAVWDVEMACPGVDVACWGFPVGFQWFI